MVGSGGLIEDLWYRDVHIHEIPQVAQTQKMSLMFVQFFQVHSLREKQWKTMLNLSLQELTVLKRLFNNLISGSIFVSLCN